MMPLVILIWSFVHCLFFFGPLFATHSLVKVDAFLCELARSMLRVFIGLILHHLHTFSTLTLLMTVFADHIQLANPILKHQRGDKKKEALIRFD